VAAVLTPERTQPEGTYRQTVRDIVGVFFLKKRVFILTFLGVIAGALILSFLVPPIYEVSTQLVVKPQFSKPLVFDEVGSRMDVFNEVKEQQLNTVIFLVTSSEVLREVVVKHQLADLTNEDDIRTEIDILRGRIKAEPLTLSSIIKVTYRGRNPQDITDQLNTLVDAFIRHHIRVNQATEGRLEFFNDQTEQLRKRYLHLNQELADTSRKLGVVRPDNQKDENLKLIKELELNKIQLLAKMQDFNTRVDNFRSALQRLRTEVRMIGLPAETIINYPALVEMEKSLAQLLINRQRAYSDYHPSSKQVQDADAQYLNMRAQIRQHMEEIIADLEGGIESARKTIEKIDSQIEETKRNNIQLAGDALEYQRLELEHKLAKDNYTLYSAKKEEARINDEKDRANFANVSIASRPTVPVKPWFPRTGLIMMLSVPLAFVLALALSAAVYAMEQRLWTPTDVSMHTRLRYLGSVDAVA
jgi:uncharacterized protein involved in exopolysaccharide biosynthesis